MSISPVLAFFLFPLILLVLWLAQFVRIHILHVSDLPRYYSLNKSGDRERSWALVTGASDGIGFGFAEELAAQNFNVILHGRNKTKLDGLIEQLQQQYPLLSFKAFVCDACKHQDWTKAFSELVEELENDKADLKILVNNVGGTGGTFNAFDKMRDRDAKVILDTIDMNASFPAAITHALLPMLERNQPALILNTGSVVAQMPPPYLGIYSASKSFVMNWNESLWQEMKAEKLDIEVLAVWVARVINAATKNRFKPTLWSPDGRTLARSALHKVGCGSPAVFAYWPHELQAAPVQLMPGWLRRWILRNEVIKEMAIEKQAK